MRLMLPVLLLLLSLPAGAALAQSARAESAPGRTAAPEERSVPGVVASVQVDRFLMNGHRDNDAVTYNVLVGSSTQFADGSTTMRLADLRPGTNVVVSGRLTMLTLTIDADRVVLGGPSEAASSSAPADTSASGTPPAAGKGKGIGGFFASFWHALFGWLHR